MKFLEVQTIEEGQVPPRARVGLFRVVDTIIEDCPILYAASLRLPFIRWKKYFDLQTLNMEQGWCVYACYITYHKWNRKFNWGGMWTPIETDDL